MTNEQRAQLAMSLRDNEVFQKALDALRVDALETLATMSRADEEKFYLSQATVKVVDEFREHLTHAIKSGAAPKKPGLA